MNTELKSLIEPELFDALEELSKQDTIIRNCLTKTNSNKEFINSLIATIICISDRELRNVEQLETLLKSNPQIQKFLESQHDTIMLRQRENNT
jgi:hypothetical protein